MKIETLNDLEAFIVEMDRLKAKSDIRIGGKLNARIELLVADIMKNGAIHYGEFKDTANGKETTIRASFQMMGYTFHADNRLEGEEIVVSFEAESEN